MPFFPLWAVAVLALLSACHSSPNFDPPVWQAHADMTEHSNPRARMVQDLMAHHLQPGLTRTAVLSLLGPPYKDGVENRLPKHITMPDTVGAIRPALYRPENRAHLPAATLHASRRINAFYREHGRPDTIMLYLVGWSTLDPNFLVIQYTGKGRVKGYWVEQH